MAGDYKNLLDKYKRLVETETRAEERLKRQIEQKESEIERLEAESDAISNLAKSGRVPKEHVSRVEDVLEDRVSKLTNAQLKRDDYQQRLEGEVSGRQRLAKSRFVSSIEQQLTSPAARQAYTFSELQRIEDLTNS